MRSMSAHAQMLSARVDSSPSSSTSAARDILSALETPAPGAQPDSCDTFVHYNASTTTRSSQRVNYSTSTAMRSRDFVLRKTSTLLIKLTENSESGANPSADSSFPRSLRLILRHNYQEHHEVSSTEQLGTCSPPTTSPMPLKVKLRGMTAKSVLNSPANSSAASSSGSSSKRTSSEAFSDESGTNYDTDSSIEIRPLSNNSTDPTGKTRTAASSRAKRVKTAHKDRNYDDDSEFDAADERESESPRSSPTVLSTTNLKRSERMLDPRNPEHAVLIAAAPKAGSEYYDSEAEDLPGPVKDTTKPHLFRNVKWGTLATDYSDPTAFPTEPELYVPPVFALTILVITNTTHSTQFVPGRYELLPDGTAFDQKHKLLIRLTDTHSRTRVFTNPPPLDWNDQVAITALNKRSVQQIRRNTHVRFREVVAPYVKQEREWIVNHLEAGKPKDGWKKFVVAFNRRFKGKVLDKKGPPRPERSHSSLTKEVERFGGVYSQGGIPETAGQSKAIGKKNRKGKKKVKAE
jgi:hypothetical protein